MSLYSMRPEPQPQEDDEPILLSVDDLQNASLDWAVAKCFGRDKGFKPFGHTVLLQRSNGDHTRSEFSTRWEDGGSIVDDMKIDIRHLEDGCEASIGSGSRTYAGPTALVAAMRCCVGTKMGDEIEVPRVLGLRILGLKQFGPSM